MKHPISRQLTIRGSLVVLLALATLATVFAVFHAIRGGISGEIEFVLLIATLAIMCVSALSFLMGRRSAHRLASFSKRLPEDIDSTDIAELMFEATDQGVFITDVNGTILQVNDAFTTITGYTSEEAIGQNPRILKSRHQGADFYREMWGAVFRDGRWSGRLWNRRKNGEAYLQQVTITMFCDAKNRPANFVAVMSDLSELHEKERHIEHQAFHDSLTDLPNRTLFQDRLAQAVARSDRTHEQLAVMLLDLDRFKYINDTLGHHQGDRMLQAVTGRLTETLRQTDTISRFGGDEFALLVTGVHDLSAVEAVARTLLQTFSLPFRIANHDLTITPSIGIAVYPDDGTDVTTLLKNADAAMYRAKERGRNGFQFYTPDMNARALANLLLESELHHALEAGQLELHYQPRVELHDGRITGMEALVRWRHPIRGLIPPAEFIPLAEESGLIVPLGQWVLEEACRQTREWMRDGFDLRVSVNISARQFNQPDLLRKVDEVLATTGLPGDRLELELTESLLMQQPENTIELLMAMKARGIWIAVDDFGTGYSSLNYLRRFPIDTLKIDRSFVNDLPGDNNAAAIAETIAALGRSLRMEVLAEGVETADQLSFLSENGCDSIQGFFFSPPLEASPFIDLVRTDRRVTMRASRAASGDH